MPTAWRASPWIAGSRRQQAARSPFTASCRRVCGARRAGRETAAEATERGSRQFGVERDFRVEDLGDRAVLLGFTGHAHERGLIQVRYRGAQRQGRAGNAKALAFRLQGDGGLGAELGRSEAAALQLERERHGETAGVRGGDELLGVGALLVLEARFERIGGLVED